MSQAGDRTRTGDAASPSAPAAAAQGGALDEFPTGTRVGAYTIMDTLGSGGMGRVYLAKDTRLHRKVALKSLLARGGSSEEQRAKVLREARAAAQVSHANVATIHEFLEVDDRSFIVMEYVEGQNLSALIRRGRMPASRVATIGRQIAHGLSAAHVRGVVHRDLKPANIKLTEDGSAKILDFGVAGLTTAFTTVSTDGSGREEAKAGQPGTPGYMSPEQLLSRKFDERTDVFSLGVVLFEMATGERGFPNTDAAELVETMSRPLRRADDVDARVPKVLADVISRATELNPDRRFQSASALASALAHVERALGAPEAGIHDRASVADAPPSRTVRRLLLTAGTIAGAVGLLILLGFVNSFTFNFVLDRSAMAGEGVGVWLVEGFRSIVPLAATLLAATAFLAVLRMIRNVIVPISRRGLALDSLMRRRVEQTTKRLGMDNIGVRASWLVLAIALSLVAIWWAFAPFMSALLTPANEATRDQLALLAPGARNSQYLYQILLTLLIVVGSLAWFKTGRALWRSGTASNRGLFAGGCAVILLALVSLQLPYRFLLKRSEAPQAIWNGATCSVTAKNPAGDVRLFCPSNNPRIITAKEADIRKLGVTENIFKPF